MTPKSNRPVNSEAAMAEILSKTTAISCKCGNQTFVQGAFLRKLSKLVSPNGEEAVIPMPTFLCNACGAVAEELLPTFMKIETAASKPAAPQSPLTLV